LEVKEVSAMRARLLLGWLVGAVLVVGCDTTQPIRQDQQTITLSFRATKANVQEMWLWRVYEDSDENGVPDDSTGDGVPDEYLWCDPQASYVSSEMPWSFSAQVDRVHRDTTPAVTIAREIEANSSFARYDPNTGGLKPAPLPDLVVSNRTGYCRFDQNILCNPDNLPTGADPPTTICEIEEQGTCIASGVCSGDSSVDCEPDSPLDFCQSQGLGTCNNVPVTRIFVYDPLATQVSGASETTLAAALNIAYITAPAAAATRGPTAGRCPGKDLGPSNVGGFALPWTFVIDRGDTVNVQARRFPDVPPGFSLTAGPPPIDPSIVYISAEADPISTTMLVDGSPVGVTGDTATAEGDPESSIDFFFGSQ